MNVTEAEIAYPRGILPIERVAPTDAFDRIIEQSMLPDSQVAIRQGVDLYIQRLGQLGKGSGKIGRALDWVFNIQRSEEFVSEFDRDVAYASVRRGVSFAFHEIDGLYGKDPYKTGLSVRAMNALAIAALAVYYPDQIEDRHRLHVVGRARELRTIGVERTQNYNGKNISTAWVMDNIDSFFLGQKIGRDQLRDNLVKFINLDSEVLVKIG